MTPPDVRRALAHCVYCGRKTPAVARCMVCDAGICWEHGARHALPICDAIDVCVQFVAPQRFAAEPGR